MSSDGIFHIVEFVSINDSRVTITCAITLMIIIKSTMAMVIGWWSLNKNSDDC